MDSESRTIDVYCPNCNLLVGAKVAYTHVRSDPQDDGLLQDLSETPQNVTEYSMSSCSRCEEVFLTRAEFYVIPGEVYAPQTGDIVLYPVAKKLDSAELPQSISRAYTTAVSSYTAGLYEPCVIMCRKCVEALCHEKGITSGTLKSRIDQLRTGSHIDQKLHTWATSLRLVGNDAAHEIGIVITKEDASDSIEFLEALLLYSLVLDRKFAAFQQRRATS